jgi:hypothetical protein
LSFCAPKQQNVIGRHRSSAHGPRNKTSSASLANQGETEHARSFALRNHGASPTN